MKVLSDTETSQVNGGVGLGDIVTGIQIVAGAVTGFVGFETNLANYAGEDATLAALNGGNLGA